MGVNLLNSAADPIAPTYGTGALSIVSGINVQETGVNSTVGDFLNDASVPGQPNGYANAFSAYQCGLNRAGGFNNGWTNGCLSHSGFGVPPTYSSGLVSFGNTGRQA
jgi:hypothetical protein